jgi:phosphohistidine phosphatase
MDLYILRHGKAEEPGKTDDSKRALTPAGKKEIRDIARWMRKEKFRFDTIASSPLIRASETAGIVASELNTKNRLEMWDELAPGGDMDTVCYHAGQSGDDASILIVGHEPSLSALIGRIISDGGTTSVIVSKGSLAKIRNYSFDSRPSGYLQWLITSKQIRAMRKDSAKRD